MKSSPKAIFFSNSSVFNPVETILKIREGDVDHYEDFTFLSRQNLWAELSQESYRGFPLRAFTGERKNELGDTAKQRCTPFIASRVGVR